jgi:hypothetical protein
VSEEELRKEAVRRRQAGESAEEVAVALGRTSRWVRKRSVRAETETDNQDRAAGRSRAPHTSPTRTAADLRQSIIDARARLDANPRGQYGPLAVAWERAALTPRYRCRPAGPGPRRGAARRRRRWRTPP